MNREENNMSEQARFLSFLIASTGSNITVPEEVLNQEMENFKCVKQVDTNDALVDALVAISQVDSQQERMEIILILMMKLVTLCNVIKMQPFILEYPEKMFKYVGEHPEVREKDPVASMKDVMGDML
jgi:hypothetical protein